MRAIQNTVYAFSGINIFAKATAQSMNKTAGSAKQTNKSLAGLHGEINNVSDNNDSGVSNIVMPNIDLSQMDNPVNKFLTSFDWFEAGVSLGDRINSFFENIDWTKAGETLSNAITSLLWSVIGFLAEVDWFKLGSSIGKFLASIDWITILGQLLIVLCEVVYGVIMTLAGFITEILKGIGKWLYDLLVKPCMEIFSALWGWLKSIVTTVWDSIKSFLENTWNKIKEIVSAIFNNVKEIISNVWNNIKTTISNIITTIKDTISNVLNTIKTVWSNIWNGIKTTVVNIWNGIWAGIKGVINCILGGIESFVNGIVKGINIVLKGISDVANAVGSLVGIDPINLRLSTITLPRLAKGNVAYSPMLALFGEYAGANSNPEITTPQNIMRETFDEVLSNHEWSSNNNGQAIQLAVYVGNKKLGDILLDNLRDMKRQSGKNIEALVY